MPQPIHQPKNKKNFFLSNFVIFVIPTLLMACSSSPKKITLEEWMTPPAGYQTLKLDKLSIPSPSGLGRYSPTGKQIIYLANKRKAHSQSQVYFFDRKTLSEKRLTFQSGQALSPSFQQKSQFVWYSSSLDARKEKPVFLKNAKERYLNKEKSVSKNRYPESHLPWFITGEPHELYSSTQTGRNRKRLTRSPQQEIFAGPYRKTEIILIKQSTDEFEVQILNRAGKFIRGSKTYPGLALSLSLHPETREVLVVSDHSKSQAAQIRLLSKDFSKEEQLMVEGYEVHSARWVPRSRDILLSASPDWHQSSDEAQGLLSDLYLFKNLGECLLRLTYSQENEFFPEFHPKENLILVQRGSGPQSQLVELQLPKTLPGCPSQTDDQKTAFRLEPETLTP